MQVLDGGASDVRSFNMYQDWTKNKESRWTFTWHRKSCFGRPLCETYVMFGWT